MITILYSCSLCGLSDAEVTIPFREESEDVITWMKQKVETALVADHQKRSPECIPQTLQNIKIPVPPGTEWFGGPVKH